MMSKHGMESIQTSFVFVRSLDQKTEKLQRKANIRGIMSSTRPQCVTSHVSYVSTLSFSVVSHLRKLSPTWG